jgi:hypothetical protein
LILSNNNLGLRRAELAQILAAIPATVTTLDLSYNDLTSLTAAELAEALAAIPATVTTLILSVNDLGLKTAAELAEALAAIPATVTTLTLSYNYLGTRRAAELAHILAAIPATVTALNLSANNLGDKTAVELAQILAAIPATVTALNLSENCLGLKTAAELAQILAAIPATVTILDLSDNNLGSLTGTELAQILDAIPTSVTSINIGQDQDKILIAKKLINEALSIIKSEDSVEYEKQSANGIEILIKAINILQAIPINSTYSKEASLLLWPHFYYIYLSEKATEALSCGAGANSHEKIFEHTGISFDDVITRAIMAGEAVQLYNTCHPIGPELPEGYVITTIEDFMRLHDEANEAQRIVASISGSSSTSLTFNNSISVTEIRRASTEVIRTME